jgi:hypothetical protein
MMVENLLSKLEHRLGGRLYARQRLGIETDHEVHILRLRFPGKPQRNTIVIVPPQP